MGGIQTSCCSAKLEFEKMGYQAQLDVFAKQQAELQKSLSKLRDIKI
jgi:hypothetical protein